jgi:hypothetical protein
LNSETQCFCERVGSAVVGKFGRLKWDFMVFQKNHDTMPELKSAVWEEIEVISTETITRVVKNFVRRLHLVHNHQGKENKNPKRREVSVKVLFSDGLKITDNSTKCTFLITLIN